MPAGSRPGPPAAGNAVPRTHVHEYVAREGRSVETAVL